MILQAKASGRSRRGRAPADMPGAVVVAGLAAFAAALACAPPPASAQSDGQWRSGEQAYAKICAYCHEAGVGPALKGRNLPPVYVTTLARRGFREMPAFPASFIDDRTLADLGAYLQKSR